MIIEKPNYWVQQKQARQSYTDIAVDKLKAALRNYSAPPAVAYPTPSEFAGFQLAKED